MNRFRILLGGVLMMSASAVMAQGAKNIRINEVLTNNTDNNLTSQPQGHFNLQGTIVSKREELINTLSGA